MNTYQWGELHFLEFNDYFKGEDPPWVTCSACSWTWDGSYMIFTSKSVLLLTATYGTDESHSATTGFKILCKEYVQQWSQGWASINVTVHRQ